MGLACDPGFIVNRYCENGGWTGESPIKITRVLRSGARRYCTRRRGAIFATAVNSPAEFTPESACAVTLYLRACCVYTCAWCRVYIFVKIAAAHSPGSRGDSSPDLWTAGAPGSVVGYYSLASRSCALTPKTTRSRAESQERVEITRVAPRSICTAVLRRSFFLVCVGTKLLPRRGLISG